MTRLLPFGTLLLVMVLGASARGPVFFRDSPVSLASQRHAEGIRRFWMTLKTSAD